MACAKLQGDRFRIEGEIDEKHALQIIVTILQSVWRWRVVQNEN